MKILNLQAVLSRVVMAGMLSTLLSGCMVSGPLSLLSAADRLLLQDGGNAEVPAGPISVRQMLANARDSSSGSDEEEYSPVATIARGPSGLDGPAFSALGEFLSNIAPLPQNEVIVTRASADKSGSLDDARFAIRVGRLVEQAGHKVRLVTSSVQESGTVFLSVARGS